MAAILTYELAVNSKNFMRSLASVEQRFVQHQARINRTLSMGGGSIRPRSSGGAARESTAMVRTQRQSIKLTEEQRKAVRTVGQEARLSHRYDLASHREKLKAVEREKRAEIGKIRATTREAARERKNGRKEFARSVGTGVSGGVGKLAAVGKAGAAMIGVGGAALAASAVTDTLKLDEQVRRLVVAGRATGATGKDPEALRKQIVSTGMDTGMAPEQVAAGMQSFVGRTGDLDMATKSMQMFATVAQATGASIEDVAGTAADLSQKFDIKTVDQMSDAFAVLVTQGKKGAFELRDMANTFPEMAAAAQRAGMKGIGGMKNLGGLAQLARQSTGSGAEASTAVQMMLTQLIADSDKLGSGEAIGKKVNIFTKKNADGTPDATSDVRDMPTVLSEVISKARGNKQTLGKLFDVRGVRAVSPLISEFKRASDEAGGGAKGEEAGRAAILAMIKEASDVQSSYAEVQRDAADVQKSTSIQFEIAMMELKDVFSTELVPTIRELAPRVRELGPAFRSITQGALAVGNALADNPVLGIGAILTMGISAEIAKAQLASVLQGGVISPLGAVGMAAGVAAGALLAYSAYLQSKANEGKQKADAAAEAGDVIRKKAAAEMDATGTLTPETRKQLQDLQATEAKTMAAAGETHNEGTLKGYGRSVMAMLGNDEAEAELERRSALQGTASSEKYKAGVGETKALLATDELSRKYGPDDFKAEAVGAAIGAAAAKKISEMPTLNRTDGPAKPVVK
jgi:Spy/CpxP family protein refolding chaperone